MSVHAAVRLIRFITDRPREFLLVPRSGAALRATLCLEPTTTRSGRQGTGEMVLDWSRLTITHGPNRLEFSRTQLRLLDVLINHRPQPLDCAELANRLWPCSGILEPDKCDAIRTEMRGLRRRLCAVGLGGAIATVRGGAYRLSIWVPCTRCNGNRVPPPYRDNEVARRRDGRSSHRLLRITRPRSSE